jgi:hypothetical protein
MHGHGAKLDLQLDCAIYLKRAEVAKYRIRFKNGKAYQFPWWEPPSRKPKVALAESKRASNDALFDDGSGYRKSWGGFAMSMSRDLYMARHHCTRPDGERGNFFHSSYLGGDPVMCAGTMLIEQGVIKKVATDSGHYRPEPAHVVNLLQMLKMHGVEVANIEVHDFDSIYPSVRGGNFLATNGNYAAMVLRRDSNWAHLNARRISQKRFGIRMKNLWDEGIRLGYYTNDTAGRTYFIGHVWPKRLNSPLNLQYTLDAFNKALVLDTPGWAENWADKWRDYLKGDVVTKRGGVKNLRKNLKAFTIWLKKNDPAYQYWPQNLMMLDAERALKEAGHEFDA